MNEQYYEIYIEAIKGRAELNEALLQKLQNKSSGDDGEDYFRAVLKCRDDLNVINNFQLNHNNHVQIDSIVIDDHAIHLFEIKNYKGIYTIDKSYIKNSYGGTITSPLIQLHRAEKELNKFCKSLGITLPIISKIVFTNPYFILKETIPQKDKIILPAEIGNIQNTFSNQFSENSLDIKRKLLSKSKDFYENYNFGITIPFSQIIPGIKCPACNRMFTVKIENQKQKCKCQYCKREMDKKYVYERNLLELWYLKRESFTMQEAMWWLGEEKISTVRRICNNTFKCSGKRYKKYFL